MGRWLYKTFGGLYQNFLEFPHVGYIFNQYFFIFKIYFVLLPNWLDKYNTLMFLKISFPCSLQRGELITEMVEIFDQISFYRNLIEVQKLESGL